jgi:hypothetical protein
MASINARAPVLVLVLEAALDRTDANAKDPPSLPL